MVQCSELKGYWYGCIINAKHEREGTWIALSMGFAWRPYNSWYERVTALKRWPKVSRNTWWTMWLRWRTWQMTKPLHVIRCQWMKERPRSFKLFKLTKLVWTWWEGFAMLRINKVKMQKQMKLQQRPRWIQSLLDQKTFQSSWEGICTYR